MADLVPPWAHDGERREPTADEIETGFGCGPFSLPLWNWMFFSLWSEIGHVLTYNGITPSNGDMEQLRKAIQAQIDASTGGGDPSSYLTLLQASSRLPIFPEVQNAAGHFGVVSPGAGQVRVPAGVSFLHRGISPYNTSQTDLATDASKAYHLRWNKTDGFTLKDLASGGYNPGTVSESDAKFDTTFDDMLVARVITNSSNVPTITNLVNRDRLFLSTRITGTATGNPSGNYNFSTTQSFNWARTPKTKSISGSIAAAAVSPQGSMDGACGYVTIPTLDRYSAAADVLADWSAGTTIVSPSAYLDFNLSA